jgi:gliding motility-associated lipoprotein GldD
MIISCAGETVYSPKPRMYPKVNYPQKSYIPFDEDFCNLTFEIPVYTNVLQEARFFEEKPVDPCWFDLEYPDFNGSLHFSYYPVGDRKSFDGLVQDAFKFVEKHDIKANYRSETIVHNKFGASGILFDIDGPVATPLQFFLSDSTYHFIRASLYFDNKVDPDSMAPIYNFVREDVLKMMETMQFINP